MIPRKEDKVIEQHTLSDKSNVLVFAVATILLFVDTAAVSNNRLIVKYAHSLFIICACLTLPCVTSTRNRLWKRPVTEFPVMSVSRAVIGWLNLPLTTSSEPWKKLAKSVLDVLLSSTASPE